jgi:DNA-binding response OmpR family regulator
LAKILVVDDERDVVDMLQFFLEKQGYQVIEALDGLEALETINAELPDLVLLDVMMPNMDGFTLSKRLLENPTTEHIPIIILTAKGHVEELFATAANVKCHVEKPFDPKELLKIIDATLSQKDAAQP